MSFLISDPLPLSLLLKFSDKITGKRDARGLYLIGDYNVNTIIRDQVFNVELMDLYNYTINSISTCIYRFDSPAP